jgi:hypothetical protein
MVGKWYIHGWDFDIANEIAYSCIYMYLALHIPAPKNNVGILTNINL